MGRCRDCGGEIIFRYIDGECRPVHLSGGCFSGESYARLDSFVNPNARCPVCGDRVFFYRSPYDGKVFFDELGPPWPKHPCTDNAGWHSPVPLSKTSAYETEDSEQEAQWQRSGWEPFRCKNTKHIESKSITEITGRVEGSEREWALYVRGEIHDLRDYPTLVKSTVDAKGIYQIATFRLEGRNSMLKEMYLDAYLPEKYR